MKTSKNAAPAALERRADLKLARLLVRAADEETRIVQADYYPAVRRPSRLAITFRSPGFDARGAGSPSRSDDFISSEIRVGAAYNWRVIDNGKVGGAVLRQREAREINACCSQNWRRTFRANWLASKTIFARLMRNTIR